MKLLLVFSAILVAASAQGLFGFGGGSSPLDVITKPISALSSLVNNIPILTDVKNYGEFLARSGKKFASEAERRIRETVFLARKNVVDSHNALFEAGKSSYELGINIFADLPNADVLKKLTASKKSPNRENSKIRKSSPRTLPGVVPDSFDWRTQGGVSPVKFQGLECGSCWSFAVTGSIEGHIFAKTKKLQPLSEQHLVDCSEKFGNFGCDGGYQDYGFEYVIDNKGIAVGDKYPYTEKNDKCQYTDAWKGAVITGYAQIDPLDENKMKEVIATSGPIACNVKGDQDSFVLYKSGIYDDATCNEAEEPNHAILVVGYGSEDGKDFWIIKNSWTDKWGEKGYMRLPRNKNFCKIAAECSYPIV